MALEISHGNHDPNVIYPPFLSNATNTHALYILIKQKTFQDIFILVAETDVNIFDLEKMKIECDDIIRISRMLFLFDLTSIVTILLV